MTANLDEWDRLSAEWRDTTLATSSSRDDASERLRARVRRHSVGLGILLATEVVLTLGVAAVVRSSLAQSGGRGPLMAAAFVAMTVFVWSFALWNRRGSWRPLGESTADYLRLSHIRARAGRRSVRFVRATILISLALYGPWFLLRLRDGRISGGEWWRWAFFAVYSTVFLLWCAWYARRLGRELSTLKAIEQELEGER
jgi:hypothetical protein